MKLCQLKKSIITLSCAVGVVAFASSVPVFAGSNQSVGGNGEEWTSMPEGGKPAFVGMQGGTVPASVYYTNGGAETTTRAGLGRDDFLEVVQGGVQSLSAENLIPFGFVDEVNATGNLASRNHEPLPRILPHGVTKIYDQELENDSLLLINELTRI